MSPKPRTIAAGKFKAQCLRLMDEVAASGQPLVITKHRRAVARLVPMEREKGNDGFDSLREALHIVGDIETPVWPQDAAEARALFGGDGGSR